MNDSTDKENIPSAQNTPQGSPVSKMWDSNDPFRNPPPLPVSPQMLKIKNTNVSRSNSPGKLNFQQSDSLEIEYQLKKVLDLQIQLKKVITGVESSVKHTQLGLDNLVARSTNNNSHLKDLLQNVENRVEGPKTSEVKELLDKVLGPIIGSLNSLEAIANSIVQQIKTEEERKTNKVIEEIKVENELIISKIHEVSESLEDHTKIQEITTKLASNESTLKSIETLHLEQVNLVKSFRTEVMQMTQEMDVSSKIEQTETTQREILSAVSSISNNDPMLAKLSDVTEILGGLGHQINSNSVDVFVKKNESQLKALISTISDSLDTQLASFSSKMELQLPQCNVIELQNKNLQLDAAHKEIDTLKAQIAEFSTKDELNKEISELTKQHTILETKYGLLNQAYSQRYEELQKLHSDYEDLITRFNNFQTGKLTSIVGGAVVSQFPLVETFPSPKKANRVLSTNSYLTNVGTPKNVKSYVLETAEE